MTPAEINRIAWKIYARPLKDGTGQILTQEFRWSGRFRGKNTQVVASPGFVWDGASIPRAAWTLVGSPFTGRYQRAALVHDKLYSRHVAFIAGANVPVSRKFADRLFRRIMKDDGTDEELADQMWLAVRLGGSHAWNT